MVTDPNTGRLVDSRYEIVDRVARGGMATVYRALDLRLDRTVALKLMHVHLADSPDFVARFRREARAAARLSNPGVVSVYDQGSLDGVAYLVMEYVPGPNLRDLIASGPLSVKEALGLTAQVLRPLGAAHRAGLVHRDVKPENVLLPSDGSVAKVADFGLARAVTEATQTTTGNVLGTVAYLAPELITAGSSSPCADVFSVGVILYELLTGEQPLSADTPIQIAFRNVHEDVPSPSALLPDLPAEVDALVAEMTRRDPELRLTTADEALARLRQIVSALTPSELAVKRGGGTGSVRTQEVLAANAAAARTVLVSTQPTNEDPDATPLAGTRTVSLPIGSIGPAEAAGQCSTSSSTLTTQDARQTTTVLSSTGRRTGRRTALACAFLLLASGTGGSAWYLTQGPGRRVTVPDVTGLTTLEARSEIEKVGLTWAAPAESYSDTVAQGAVISTEPVSGSSLRTDDTVKALISKGIEQKTVPPLSALTQEEARTTIQDAGLTLGAVTQDFSADVPEGQVISCDPTTGTVLNHSSAVAIVVSKGRRPATVPDVTGMSQEEASTALQTAGLVVGTVTQVFSNDVAAGTVISTDPATAAAGLFAGDSVSMSVSKGPEMVTVPNVTSMSRDSARTALEAAGLSVSVNEFLGGLFGTARATDPAAGTSVRKGSSVTLYVV